MPKTKFKVGQAVQILESDGKHDGSRFNAVIVRIAGKDDRLGQMYELSEPDGIGAYLRFETEIRCPSKST